MGAWIHYLGFALFVLAFVGIASSTVFLVLALIGAAKFHREAREQIEAGMVHVNSPTVGGEAQIPFGGMKSSGVGEREQGPTALDFYTDVKVVYIDYTGAARTSKFY